VTAADLARLSASEAELDAMRTALEEAALAPRHGDVPIGAAVVFEGRVVSRRHNERELRQDPIAHAETLALRDASEALGSWRLLGATLVVTLEPCSMCAGAAVAARIGRLVFGADDPKAGACGSLYNLCSDPRLNHEVTVVPRVLASESSALLTGFFEDLRER
jgi:tRNA(Arg) A34 adenosine deaminase TadA